MGPKRLNECFCFSIRTGCILLAMGGLLCNIVAMMSTSATVQGLSTSPMNFPFRHGVNSVYAFSLINVLRFNLLLAGVCYKKPLWIMAFNVTEVVYVALFAFATVAGFVLALLHLGAVNAVTVLVFGVTATVWYTYALHVFISYYCDLTEGKEEHGIDRAEHMKLEDA